METLSFSISTISSVPFNTVIQLQLRHLRCCQSFLPTSQRWHKRNRSLARDILRIRKNIVVQACCGHFPLCSTFSKNSTTSPLVSFVKSRETLEWKPPHPTPVFALCRGSRCCVGPLFPSFRTTQFCTMLLFARVWGVFWYVKESILCKTHVCFCHKWSKSSGIT